MGNRSLDERERQPQAVHAATAFSLEEQVLDAGCLQIRVGGELDLATSDRLVASLDRALASRAHVVLNLEQCSFLDSTGIAAIVWARRRLAELGRGLYAVGAEGAVARVLEITGLTKTDLVQDDVEAALLACRRLSAMP